VATGSKVASVIALLKVMLQALGPWSSRPEGLESPGWLGPVAVIAAVTMTYGNFAALAQGNLKRMLAYSSVAHAGYLLVGIIAASVSVDPSAASGAVLFYLVVYAFTTMGAFAVAAWLFRDGGSERIDDLDGLGAKAPLLGVCIVILMLSLIGLPPFAGFFAKLFLFMEALHAAPRYRLTFLWLVGLGFLNSVVSAFYYARVLRALFLRPERPGAPRKPATAAIAVAIMVGAAVAVGFGVQARSLSSESIALARSRLFAVPGPIETVRGR
jgi:NADH-quinone oxidoreductase subunit N